MSIEPTSQPRLSREAILDAALHVCREEGFLALTMRRIADVLGVSPMAVYRHFDSKADLVGALLDGVWAQTVLPVEQRDPDPRERAIKGLVRFRRSLLANGDVAMLAAALPRPSAEMVRNLHLIYEVGLDLGFSEAQIPRAFAILMSHTLGSITFAATRDLVDRISNIDAEGQAQRLAAVEEAAALPAAERQFLGRMAAGSPDDGEGEFEFGARLLLDGLLRWAEADADRTG